MSATLLARKMMDGLSPAAEGEMRAALADLSASGKGDLVAVFDKLLAGEDMAKALGLPPATADLLYAQAHARFNAGHLTDALVLFQALVVLAPNGKDHWLGLGICMRLLEMLPGARLAFATALEIAPDCPAVMFHLAELSFAEADLPQAKRLLGSFAALPDSALKARLEGEAGRLSAVIQSRVT